MNWTLHMRRIFFDTFQHFFIYRHMYFVSINLLLNLWRICFFIKWKNRFFSKTNVLVNCKASCIYFRIESFVYNSFDIEMKITECKYICMKKSNQDESNGVWKVAQILFAIVYILHNYAVKSKGYILLAADCKWKRNFIDL